MFLYSSDAGKGLYLKMVYRHVGSWTSAEDPEFNEPDKDDPLGDDEQNKKPGKGGDVKERGTTRSDMPGGKSARANGPTGAKTGAAQSGGGHDDKDEPHGLVVRPLPSLPCDIPAMLDALFQGLEREYGVMLTSRAFAYLSLSACGLTRRELGDILTCDNDVLEEVNDRLDDAFNATAVVPGMGFAPPLASPRRVPPLVLSRLIADVGDLMQESYSGYGLVLRWQHREIWGFVGSRYIPDGATKRRLSRSLVDYFDGTSHYRHPECGVQSQPLWFVPPVVGTGVGGRAVGACKL